MPGLLPTRSVFAIVGGRTPGDRIASAVVRVGGCSGVLVEPKVVLTSAHCLDGPIEEVTVADDRLRVTACRRDPRYEAGRAAHDVGYCRLANAAHGEPIAIDDVVPAAGAPVTLAGFGLGDALGRAPAALRSVRTRVGRVAADVAIVGSATETACRGDSGGPVLADTRAGMRVAAVIHGGVGPICASPAQVVTVASESEWLFAELGAGHDAVSAPHLAIWLGIAAVAVASACAVLRTRRLRRARRLRKASASGPP